MVQLKRFKNNNDDNSSAIFNKINYIISYPLLLKIEI